MAKFLKHIQHIFSTDSYVPCFVKSNDGLYSKHSS